MSVELQLPPGFRFHPTDEELVMHYLCRKCASQQIAVPIVAEIDLYKYNPWELPGLASYGEKEWYFFSPRDRKYPNGSRPNRAAGSGYWKATGADKAIGRPKAVGIKKALVFYSGKAPRGEKTNWIMHEYRLADVDRSARKNNSSLRLDDWVLCRIYNKKGTVEKAHVSSQKMENYEVIEEQKPDILTRHSVNSPAAAFNDMVFTSDSVPRLHTDSSCSEHVVSPCEREVQSEAKVNKWENDPSSSHALDYQSNYMDATLNIDGALDDHSNLFGSQFQSNYQMSPLQDMFMYLQKPFFL